MTAPVTALPERPVGVESIDDYIVWLRKQWRGATPDRRAEIEADVARLQAAQARGKAWLRARAAAEHDRVTAFYATRDRIAAEWPPERIRALMTGTTQ
jgi:hypothetical protein